MTLQAIGDELGVTKQTVHARLRIEMAEAAEARRDLATNQLQIELAGIDLVLEGMTPLVESGDPRAATAFLKAMERRARLLGLDAPDKLDVAGSLNTDPAAIHARLGAIAARAALVVDADAARGADGDGAG